MTENIHRRAQQLIAQERIESISDSDSAWLAIHVHECVECANLAQATSAALRALRTMPIALPAGLAERTQFRVSLRARQLRTREPQRRALWIAAVVSWAGGVASAPLVWRLFAWLGEYFHAPKIVWESAFAMWWIVPALVASVVLLSQHERHRGEAYWLQGHQ